MLVKSCLKIELVLYLYLDVYIEIEPDLDVTLVLHRNNCKQSLCAMQDPKTTQISTYIFYNTLTTEK